MQKQSSYPKEQYTLQSASSTLVPVDNTSPSTNEETIPANSTINIPTNKIHDAEQMPNPPKEATNINTSTQQQTKNPARNVSKMKTIEIVGDSMLLGVDEKEMRENNIIRVRPHSGVVMRRFG